MAFYGFSYFGSVAKVYLINLKMILRPLASNCNETADYISIMIF